MFLFSAMLAGCGRNSTQVYQVPKETAQLPPNAAGAPAPQPGAAEALPGLRWKLPAGWQEVPPGQMRVASFRVAGGNGKQADVSVVPLPELAGRDLDNVNRWRGQVSLPPVTEAEMSKLAQPVEIVGEKAQLYDQAGQNAGSGEPTRILAAVLRHDDVAWFFKMTGDDALVAGQKPAFVEFLKSLVFTQGTMPELPPSHPPIGGAGLAGMGGAMGAAAASSGQDKPLWQVPPGWQEVPGGAFLVAKFNISGGGGEAAAVNVSASSGSGGGVVGNVNRWRQQLGLGELPEDEVNKLVTPLDLPGGKASLVDLSGTEAKTARPTRLIGAIVPQGARSWFYKLMGSETLVAREAPAFRHFVKSAQYAPAK